VTYLTGLKPPGGMWKDGGGGHSAGNPVLYDTNRRRYNAFFYSNSTAFMASIVVMGLLLSRMRMMRQRQQQGSHRLPLWPMHAAMFLGMTALLVAYAAGSARDSCTSWKVIVLLVPIVAFVMCLFAFYKEKEAAKGDNKEPRSTGV
jgi:peptidoglycan/LPS O-acetylase OafA/YrhL